MKVFELQEGAGPSYSITDSLWLEKLTVRKQTDYYVASDLWKKYFSLIYQQGIASSSVCLCVCVCVCNCMVVQLCILTGQSWQPWYVNRLVDVGEELQEMSQAVAANIESNRAHKLMYLDKERIRH